MSGRIKILLRIATAIAVAIVVFSCKNIPDKIDQDLSSKPAQRIEDMFAVQTSDGKVSMRIEAPVMERYYTDSTSTETFPDGFYVYAYTDDGLLESLILSERAQHITYKNRDEDVWQATGNVVIHNVPELQTMETDTIYWDIATHEIYTDSYVKMYAPSGFMQGYGMRANDRGTESTLFNPFDSYGVTAQDTTTVVLDTINFIGPFPQK